MSKITIRSLQINDFPTWLPLWDGNNLGQRDERVTAETWSRLVDESNKSVNGICALYKGEMAGLIHYIVHPTTGSIQDICYMQDVFVNPEFRQKGIARKLVHELSKIGRQEKWARMYWLAEADNEAVQSLYENIGVKLNFTLHVLPF